MVKYALITLLVILIFTIVVRVLIKHRNKRREQKVADFNKEVLRYLTQILSLADQGNDNAKEEVMRIWKNHSDTLGYDFPDMKPKFCQMNSSIMDEKELEEKLPKLRELFAKSVAATDLVDRLSLYTKFYQFWKGCGSIVKDKFSKLTDGVEPGSINASMITLLQSRMNELAQQAISDPIAFKSMVELSQMIIQHSGEYYAFREKIVYPDNWNDLVAQHVKNPHYREFIGTKDPRDLPSGHTRRMAAEALRTEDLVGAKIALSYCNCNKYVLAEVGSTLTADLAKFIARHEATIEASVETES